MKTAIWWVRRDLRINDNQALMAAVESHLPVIPVFILDPNLLNSPYSSEKRNSFLWGGLKALDARLRVLGSYLVLRQGNPLDELKQLVEETDAWQVYAEPDYSPYAQQRDQEISKSLPMEWIGSPAFHPPGTILKSNAEPYTVFTPFSKAWKALPGLTAAMHFSHPETLNTPTGIFSLPIPGDPDPSIAALFPPGEMEAQQRLADFTAIQPGSNQPGSPAPVYSYADSRNRMDWEGTSMLSPYLRFGMLSARQAVAAAYYALQHAPDPLALKSAETWLNELIWRDFYIHILYHFPQVRKENFRLPGVRWTNNQEQFTAWCEGRTGFPVVDAAMRQLLHTGWMHNRARMVVASFLTKDLLIDWRWGERWFMQHLVDGDPASNNGGWQWTAGTGTDAAPYFRIFNPTSQGKRHDPNGDYVRNWVPELAKVPAEYIHEPWQMPGDMQRQVGCQVGSDYPTPIVDHSQARQKALEVYEQGK